MLLLALAGWLNRRDAAIIDHLREENRVRRELHGMRRLRFTDDQGRRLAAKKHGVAHAMCVLFCVLATVHGAPKPRTRGAQVPASFR